MAIYWRSARKRGMARHVVTLQEECKEFRRLILELWEVGFVTPISLSILKKMNTMFNKSDKPTPYDLALERRKTDHTIFIWEIETKVTWNGGAHDEKADLIEQIEKAGWRLDQMVIYGQRWQLVFRVEA